MGLSVLAEAFGWWWRQMRSLIPGQAARPGMADALIVAVDRFGGEPGAAMTAQIFARRGGHEVAVVALDFSRPFIAQSAWPSEIALRLPEGAMLQRQVVLPAAAGRDLAAVIGFEMDRLTPFSADEVFWGVSGMKRDQARLRLNLLVVPRLAVERLLEALREIGLFPGFIESGAGRIPLAKQARRGWGSGALLAGVCAALAILCVATPLIHQQSALNAANHRIKTLMPVQREIVMLRQGIASLSAGQGGIAAAQDTGDVLRTLAVTTDALPDGTWLSNLTLASNELTIDGQSSNAAHLISLLAAAPGLHNPRFIAPVTRAENGNADLFSIQVSVAK